MFLLEKKSRRRSSSECRLPNPQVSTTFSPSLVSTILPFFFLVSAGQEGCVLRSRAIDHCRESHAFAQVNVQGSFPPLRCTNPPRAHAWRSCVCMCVCVRISVGTTHEGENAMLKIRLERRSSSRIDESSF